ncbi:MAG: hypothetical protein KBD78_00905 [Oligoflexales bacterium]|nr:hypothetical protein [Oligoflexales bacterium]
MSFQRIKKGPKLFALAIFVSAFACGESKPDEFKKLAPSAKLPMFEQKYLGLQGEFEYLQMALGSDLAELALCGELQARLQAIYWELFQGSDSKLLSNGIAIDENSGLIRESGILEGQLLDISDRCGIAYNNFITYSAALNARLLEVPAIFKFLTNLVGISSDSESKLITLYQSLNDIEKENLFQAIRSGHARYSEKIELFGSSSQEFGVKLTTGQLKNEALAILKIANTGDNENGNGFSKAFWDKAQEDKLLPIDLSLKVGSAMIREGADVLIEVATGSAMGEFGKGVGRAKKIIDEIDKAESFLEKTYSEIKSFYDTRVKGFFSGGRRGSDLEYTEQEFIDFHGNISITPNGVVQVKNYRDLAASDLRAKVAFSNASDVDSIVLVHEFKDGRRSVQVITQVAGGTMPQYRYIPSSEHLSENATTIIAVKRDPLTGAIKYTSTSARFEAEQTATITLEVPEVSSGNEENPELPTDSQTMCLLALKELPGTVCLDFAQGSAPNPSAAAKSFCDGVQGNISYESASLVNSCPTAALIKSCSSTLYKATFYSTDANQANNIVCDSSGQWVWGG